MVDTITNENQENSQDVSAQSSVSKPKRGRPTKNNKKKDDETHVDCPDTGSNTSLSMSLPKSKIKENEFLESIRTMINITVTESVALASSYLRDEIHQMRPSFDSKIEQLSEKETQHYVESGLEVRGELDKIRGELSPISELKRHIESVLLNLNTQLEAVENKQLAMNTIMEEKIITVQVMEEKHYSATLDRLNDQEKSQRSLSKSLAEILVKDELLDTKIVELEKIIATSHIEIISLREKIDSLPKIPDNIAGLGEDLEAKKESLVALQVKATTIVEQLQSVPNNQEELAKVKTKGEENSDRLDRIQKGDKMMNLLTANLPPNLQTIQGFAGFAYNELNIELAPGDVMFFNKVFESANRVVHLVRFRSLDIRNAIFRSRVNLGFRSKIWINEDLIPGKIGLSKEALPSR